MSRKSSHLSQIYLEKHQKHQKRRTRRAREIQRRLLLASQGRPHSEAKAATLYYSQRLFSKAKSEKSQKASSRPSSLVPGSDLQVNVNEEPQEKTQEANRPTKATNNLAELSSSINGEESSSDALKDEKEHRSRSAVEASKCYTDQHPSDHSQTIFFRVQSKEKKLKKQIRSIQKAVDQETLSSRKGNSMILRGLKKALGRLSGVGSQSIASIEEENIQIDFRSQGNLSKLLPPVPSSLSDSATSLVVSQDIVKQDSPTKIPALIIIENTLTEASFPFEKEIEGRVSESQAALDTSRASQQPVSSQPSDKPTDNMAEDSEKEETQPRQIDAGDPEAQDLEMADAETSSSSHIPLDEKCHHYQKKSDVEWDIQKYWAQRYSIFSRYDEGIHMTDDAWFGVTPEPVANKVAEDLSKITSPSKTILVDMFAGAGGNVIAFALSNRWTQIIAIEKDSSTLACAQHNAWIYGVYEKITWINDDSFSYLSSPTCPIDPSKTIIFASPPWGGPGYTTDEIFDLSKMMPYSLSHIYTTCSKMDSALYLPRTSDLRQISKLVPEGKKIEVVQYCMAGASKAMVAYLPAIVS